MEKVVVDVSTSPVPDLKSGRAAGRWPRMSAEGEAVREDAEGGPDRSAAGA
jgi:hypothetical protein